MMVISTAPARDREAHSPVRRLVTAIFAGWSLGLVFGTGAVVIAESPGLPTTQFPLALGIDVAVEYDARRFRLAAEDRFDRETYTQAKRPFIAAITAVALETGYGSAEPSIGRLI
jgi:hypothetical protein